MSFSVIIQGPMKNNVPSLLSLPMYEKIFDEIIISCYDGDELHKDLEKHTVIRNPSIEPSHNNQMNIYGQCLTTLAGAKASHGDFVLKVRSDECFYTVLPILEAQLHNADKIIYSGEFHARQIVDHAFSMRRHYLVATCEWLLAQLEGPIIIHESPEYLFSKAFLRLVDPSAEYNRRLSRFLRRHAIGIPHVLLSPMVWSKRNKYRLEFDYV